MGFAYELGRALVKQSAFNEAKKDETYAPWVRGGADKPGMPRLWQSEPWRGDPKSPQAKRWNDQQRAKTQKSVKARSDWLAKDRARLARQRKRPAPIVTVRR